MNANQKKESLLQEILSLQKQMDTCKHDFKNAIYDPEIIRVGYGLVQDGAGSDPHWSYAGYEDKEKDRWSRECKLCGKKEYTYTKEPVIIAYKPKF